MIIYTDASCRNNKDAIQGQSVGLGIYIRDDANQKNWRIKIQAISQQEATVFQAEAKALSLAAKIPKMLQVDTPTFLTDNQVPAKTAASRKIDHPLLHWNARNHLAQFFRDTTGCSPQVFHISRELNQEAHKCASQVFRPSLNRPIFQCTNSTHPTGACPVLSTLQDVHLQDFVFLAAICS